MSDIAKGVLGGGWAALVGWFVPAAANLILFAFFVMPSLVSKPPFKQIATFGVEHRLLLLAGATVLLGLVLMSMYKLLYQVFEGHAGWPSGIWEWRKKRQTRVKYCLELELLPHVDKPLSAQQQDRLETIEKFFRENRLGPANRRTTELPPLRRQLKEAKLARFPCEDEQITSTRLGNAIRRMEWYGQDRYRLDSPTLWYELLSVVPDRTREDVQRARAGVDFYVALIYGHILVAISALVALGIQDKRRPLLAITAAALIALTFLWYRFACFATDDWASAVQAVVNVGRQPLSKVLGLQMPQRLEDERAMWAAVGWLTTYPFGLYPKVPGAVNRFRRPLQRRTRRVRTPR